MQVLKDYMEVRVLKGLSKYVLHGGVGFKGFEEVFEEVNCKTASDHFT